MIGRLIKFLILGYIGLVLCLNLIPNITALSSSDAYTGMDPGIVKTAIDIALWVVPIAAVVGLVMYAVDHFSHSRGRKGSD